MSLNPENVLTPEEAWELNHKAYEPVSRTGLFLQRAARGAAAILGISSAVAGIEALQSRPVYAASCGFELGFKALRDQIPGIVGDCRVNVHYNSENGDGLQETAGPTGLGGLLVWRKADNWTAYTDGARTWINGPYGLQSRPNTERFSWEEGGQELQKQLPPVWQGREWPALSQDVARKKGLHTLYELGGALDLYDQSSGSRTNFRQQAEDAATNYFTNNPYLSQVQKETSGYCHGVANAAAYGEAEPVGDEFMSKEIKIDLLAALHSGDKQYKPGKDKLFNGLKEGKRFVVEFKDSSGFWSRVAYETAGEGRARVTDFDRSPKIISLDDPSIVNMYIPVIPGEEGKYKDGPIESVGAGWVFNLNQKLVYHLVYGTPLN